MLKGDDSFIRFGVQTDITDHNINTAESVLSGIYAGDGVSVPSAFIHFFRNLKVIFDVSGMITTLNSLCPVLVRPHRRHFKIFYYFNAV